MDDKIKLLNWLRAGSEGKLDLRWANLENIDLRGADLRGVNFAYCNLNGSILKDANLTGCNLSHCLINKVNWQGVKMTGCIVDGAEIKNSLLGVDTTGVDFAQAWCYNSSGTT